MGTDIGGYGYGDTAYELELLVANGLSPAKAIQTATLRSAECLGLAERLGTLEPGKEADLLVVDGDPLEDITVLRRRDRLALVMQAGRVVGGTMQTVRVG
jgi:imidazolonepropionase-like amidohydrolase